MWRCASAVRRLGVAALMALCGTTLAQADAGETKPAAEAVKNVEAVLTPSQRLPWRTSEYTLMARGMSLPDVLTAFALSQEMGVVIDKDVRGVVSGDFQALAPWAFLDRICAMNNLIWYFEGSILYIYRAGAMSSALVDLKAMKAAEVQRMLRELGVEDSRYPLRKTSGDELVAVSGPPRYVELVVNLIGKADRLKAERSKTDVIVRIFPIVHAWAEDISLDTGGDSTQIRGIATILSDMMKEQKAERTKEVVGATGDKGAEGETSGEETAVSDSFQPVIKADSRLNVVMVRDRASRMPLYESLIRELDVPVELIEIQVSVIDISRDDALDWELSLRGSLQRSNTAGAAGQAAANLLAPEALAGLGLAGALIYTGSSYALQTSLTALTQQGKARAVSRPTILTLNNLQAELKDSKGYHVRVVGKEVAELKEVSTGIELRVRPRIVGDRGSRRRQIWMTLELDDGGFESIAVDSMPMTRTSSLDTQAAVYEGQSLLLGGYLRDIEEERKWGIPWLRDLPWIGFLFGGVSKVKQNVQRMFILTPHIVDLADMDLPVSQSRRLRDMRQAEELEWEADRTDRERGRRVRRRQELEGELEQARQKGHAEEEASRQNAERKLEWERRGVKLNVKQADERREAEDRQRPVIAPADNRDSEAYEAQRIERQRAEDAMKQQEQRP